MRTLKTLTSFTNHWQKAVAIHSLNSTVHPNDLLGVIGWLANLKGTPCFITSHLLLSASVQSYQIFLFPQRSLSYFILWFQAWGKDAGKDTPPYEPSSAILALPLVILAVVLRTTCWLPTCPTWCLARRLEIWLSPWLCYYLAVWPCTSYFTSLGLGSLNLKMKEPNWKLSMTDTWVGIFSLCRPYSPTSVRAWRHTGLHRASHSTRMSKVPFSPIIHNT